MNRSLHRRALALYEREQVRAALCIESQVERNERELAEDCQEVEAGYERYMVACAMRAALRRYEDV